MEQDPWRKRRDILISLVCLGIILWVAWLLLNQFVDAVLILLLSMTVAFLITPVVNRLVRWHIPRIIATFVVYIIVLAAISGLSYALIFALVAQVQQFSATVINFFSALPSNFTAFLTFLHKQGNIPDENIKAALNQVQSQATNFANQAATNALNIVLFLTNTFLDFIIVLVISFYLTLDGKRIRGGIMNIVPQNSRPTFLLLEDALNRVVGNYIRGQLFLAIIIGVLVALVCVITGLGQFALIFGVLGFLFETIPMVGPGLASIFPLLTSLLLPHPFPRTIYIIICFIIIQAFESNILGPRIVGHAVGLHPVASIMALLVFARLFGGAFGAFGGAVGALIATPLVAAIWVVIASLYRSAHGVTADQMLPPKRHPSWKLRRPPLPSQFRVRRSKAFYLKHDIPQAKTTDVVDNGNTGSNVTNGSHVQHDDETSLPSPLPNEQIEHEQ